jgi:hypothetical protein
MHPVQCDRDTAMSSMSTLGEGHPGNVIDRATSILERQSMSLSFWSDATGSGSQSGP